MSILHLWFQKSSELWPVMWPSRSITCERHIVPPVVVSAVLPSLVLISMTLTSCYIVWRTIIVGNYRDCMRLLIYWLVGSVCWSRQPHSLWSALYLEHGHSSPPQLCRQTKTDCPTWTEWVWLFSHPVHDPHHCKESSRWQCLESARAPTVNLALGLQQNENAIFLLQ